MTRSERSCCSSCPPLQLCPPPFLSQLTPPEQPAVSSATTRKPLITLGMRPRCAKGHTKLLMSPLSRLGLPRGPNNVQKDQASAHVHLPHHLPLAASPAGFPAGPKHLNHSPASGTHSKAPSRPSKRLHPSLLHLEAPGLPRPLSHLPFSLLRTALTTILYDLLISSTQNLSHPTEDEL